MEHPESPVVAAIDSLPSSDDSATPKVNVDVTTDTGSTHSFAGEQDSGWNSMCPPLPSPTTQRADMSPDSLLMQYIEAVREHMNRSCDVTALAKSVLRNCVEATPLPTGDGAAAVEVPWFDMMHRWAAEALDAEDKIMVSMRPCGVGDAAVEGAPNLCAAREMFASYLRELSERIVYEVYTAHARVSGSRYRHSFHVSSLPAQLMYRAQETMLCSCKGEPHPNSVTTGTSGGACASVCLQAFAGAEDPTDCEEDDKDDHDKESEELQDLRTALLADVDAWIVSFLPYTRFAASSVACPLQLLWSEPDAAARREEAAFYVYTLAMRENRLDRPDAARGALLPRAWLRDAISWLRGDCDVVPGPFDTFRLATVAPDGRHVVRAGAADVDVVPEELFDKLWALFGGGPKYIARGAFRSRGDIAAALRPPRAAVSIALDGIGGRAEARARGVLHRATLMEAVRRAALRADGALWAEAVPPEWRAALCARDGVRIAVTHVGGVELGTPIQMPAATSVGEAIAACAWKEGNTLQRQGDSLGLHVWMRQEVSQENLATCGVCGLTNVGNTCYMNSGLQCLSNLASLRRELLALPLSEYAAAPITTGVVELLRVMWSGCAEIAETMKLKTAIGHKKKEFEYNDQQDAMEFIEVLLDCMHEEMNAVAVKSYRERMDEDKAVAIPTLSNMFWTNFMDNNQSFIPKLFFHQSKTRLECLTCGESRVVFDNNPTLSATVVTPLRACVVEVVLLFPLKSSSKPMWGRARMRVKLTTNEDSYISVDEVKREVTALLRSNEDKSKIKNNTRDKSVSKGNPLSKHIENDNDDINRDNKDCGAVLGPTAPPSDADENNNTSESLTPCTDSHDPNMLPDNDVIPESIPESSRDFHFSKGANANNSDVTNGFDEDNARRLNEALQEALVSCRVRIFADSNKPLYVGRKPLYAALLPTTADNDNGGGGDNSNNSNSSNSNNSNNNNNNEQPSVNVGKMNTECSGEENISDSVGGNGTPGPHYAWYFIKSCNESQYSLHHPCHAERLPCVDRERVTSHVVARCRELCQSILYVFYGSVNMNDGLHEVRMDHLDKDQRASTSFGANIDKFQCATDIDATGDIRVVIECRDYLQLSDESNELIHPSFDAWRPNYTYGRCPPYFDFAESVTLDECLRCTFLPDTLTNDDALYCDKCKEHRSSKAERSLFLLPTCLMISLKRFRARLQEMSKNNTTVTFPEVLDVAPYMDSEAPAQQCTRYRLRGVVNHRGSLMFGHYTAIAYNESAQNWVFYDDGHAMAYPEETPTPQGVYIMFYEREDSINLEDSKKKSCGMSRL